MCTQWYNELIKRPICYNHSYKYFRYLAKIISFYYVRCRGMWNNWNNDLWLWYEFKTRGCASDILVPIGKVNEDERNNKINTHWFLFNDRVTVFCEEKVQYVWVIIKLIKVNDISVISSCIERVLVWNPPNVKIIKRLDLYSLLRILEGENSKCRLSKATKAVFTI